MARKGTPPCPWKLNFSTLFRSFTKNLLCTASTFHQMRKKYLRLDSFSTNCSQWKLFFHHLFHLPASNTLCFSHVSHNYKNLHLVYNLISCTQQEISSSRQQLEEFNPRDALNRSLKSNVVWVGGHHLCLIISLVPISQQGTFNYVCLSCVKGGNFTICP